MILLDCYASLGMLIINALAATGDVLVPMQAHYLSPKGFEQLIKTISKNVKRKLNPKLDIAGIFITITNMRTNYSQEIEELLCGTYGGEFRIFDSSPYPSEQRRLAPRAGAFAFIPLLV